MISCLLLCQCAGLAVVCLTLVLFRCYFAVIPPYFGVLSYHCNVDVSKKQRVCLPEKCTTSYFKINYNTEFKLGLRLLLVLVYGGCDNDQKLQKSTEKY